VNTITIPEGYSLLQIVPLLAKTLDVSEDSVNAAVRDTALLAKLDIPTPTLEGYLFPSTYAFPAGTTARLAVNEMVREFEREWQPRGTPACPSSRSTATTLSRWRPSSRRKRSFPRNGR
jgi:Predicted periplasmic solute-binding protein